MAGSRNSCFLLSCFVCMLFGYHQRHVHIGPLRLAVVVGQFGHPIPSLVIGCGIYNCPKKTFIYLFGCHTIVQQEKRHWHWYWREIPSSQSSLLLLLFYSRVATTIPHVNIYLTHALGPCASLHSVFSPSFFFF
ncbi:hypothetical protein BX661DRAFT_81845 [Kickxella alabastrina]|uniref:uncharacterized protein n=1 Tax=Kickxella alabastrina TaxID=61397 RepID=UPI00221EB4B5|nr:uncharacterized protein BX661DRAFT_81845 [Kickxella alabastrina]KAI7833052.1 hypothetical protein BX661DRAFT_81845 [Kickxella alabastrina]